jgi:hypothetical protein
VLGFGARGLLDRTLIVLASEFSRDALLEGKPDKPVKDQVDEPPKVDDLKILRDAPAFHRRRQRAAFGGGIKRGHLHGVTADERPCKTIKDRVVIEDLHASIYHALGISPRCPTKSRSALSTSRATAATRPWKDMRHVVFAHDDDSGLAKRNPADLDIWIC